MRPTKISDAACESWHAAIATRLKRRDPHQRNKYKTTRRAGPMDWVRHAVTSAPEIFIFLSVAIGTLFGRIRIRGFALGATACTLIVAVFLGLLGTFVIPPLLKSIFFGLFVFTIGYRSGPEFFASLSWQTLNQVVLALVIGATGLVVVLVFAFMLHLDSGTAAGLASGSLTQSSMMGTASGALEQLGLQP